MKSLYSDDADGRPGGLGGNGKGDIESGRRVLGWVSDKGFGGEASWMADAQRHPSVFVYFFQQTT